MNQIDPPTISRLRETNHEVVMSTAERHFRDKPSLDNIALRADKECQGWRV